LLIRAYPSVLPRGRSLSSLPNSPALPPNEHALRATKVMPPTISGIACMAIASYLTESDTRESPRLDP